MKAQHLRIALIVIIALAGIFSAVLLIHTMAGDMDKNSIYVIVGINMVIMIVACVIIKVYGLDRRLLWSIDKLEEETGKLQEQCTVYEKATVEMQRLQLGYNYKKTVLEGGKPAPMDAVRHMVDNAADMVEMAQLMKKVKDRVKPTFAEGGVVGGGETGEEKIIN